MMREKYSESSNRSGLIQQGTILVQAPFWAAEPESGIA